MGAEGTARWDLLWALAGVVAVVTSPHLNPHDLTLLIFPAWIVGTHIMSSGWPKWLSTLWLFVLWVGYALPPLTLYQDNTALAVIPSVGIMAASILLLAWQLGFGKPRTVESAVRSPLSAS